MRSEKYQRNDRIKEKIHNAFDGIITFMADCVNRSDDWIDSKVDEIMKRKDAIDVLKHTRAITSGRLNGKGQIIQALRTAVKTMQDIENVCNACGAKGSDQGCANCRWDEAKS